MKGCFVNFAFDKAIKDYLKCQDNKKGILYNSFLVVCLRLLMIIYGESDILNPYNEKKEEILLSNLTKFGYPLPKVNDFLENFEKYLEKEDANAKVVNKENPYFITLQKDLIDMIMFKKVNFHILDQEIKDFYSLLYTKDSKEPIAISLNYLLAPNNLDDVRLYFETEMIKNVKIEEEAPKNYLNNRSYEIMGYSMDDIEALSEEELEKMNHQVYDYFKIRENAINKEYLLEKAIEEFENKKEPLTSGNGYVDILLIMSIITTLVMVGAIVTFIVF